MSLLDVRSVAYGYPGTFLLRDVDFNVGEGEVLCLMGPNGSGKTTLLALMAGYCYPMAGSVYFQSRELHANPIISQSEITYVPFMPRFSTLRTPYLFWQAIGHLYGLSYRETAARIDELAPQMQLAGKMHVSHGMLSLGMREKVAIIAAFLPDVKLRLLDEPFSGGVDPLGMEVLAHWVQQAQGRGESIVFTSQLIEHGERLADRIAILKRGQLTAIGTPQELIKMAGVSSTADRALAQAYILLSESNP